MTLDAKLLIYGVILICHVLAMDRNEWAGKLMRKIKFGDKVSMDILEDNDENYFGIDRKPDQNGTFVADHDVSYDSTEDNSEDLGKNVMNLKLSDILKLIEKLKKPIKGVHGNEESKAENQSRLSILEKLFRILISKFRGDRDIIDDFQRSDEISFAEIKRFLSQRFQKSISIGCLGDLLYFVDSLVEHGMARRDLSHVCQKSVADGDRENNRSVDCDCTSKVQSILDEHEWTLDVVDSFGKFPSGLTRGNLWFQGDFEQCTEISVNKRSRKHKWEGRYSRIDFFIYKNKLYSPFIENDRKGIFSDVETGLNVIQLPSSLPECNVFFQVKYGACFPKTCTKEDLETIVEYVVNIPQKLLKKRVVCASNILYHDDPSIFEDFPALIVAFIVMIFILLGIFGTLYDWHVHTRFDKIVYHEMNHNSAKEKSESNVAEKIVDTRKLVVLPIFCFPMLVKRRSGKQELLLVLQFPTKL
uniref:Nose resistant-to-fluoxetine protein N-terminal domain-containing protein n=1 Tax=Romanomermis culicivorax TaxID=13658 RepID=A0A915KCP1_ROMCU